MLRWLLFPPVAWKMRSLPRGGQGHEHAEQITDEVLDAFLDAARVTLESGDVVAADAAVPWNRKAFYWEGHAFALAMRQSFGARSSSDRIAAPGHRYMYYTGLGVWQGVARYLRLPRVSLDPQRWLDVDDFLGCRPLLAGGQSFSEVCIRGRVELSDLAPLAAEGDHDWLTGTFQGAGRAMWFLYMRSPERLIQALQGLGEHAEFAAEGVGLAFTYTQLADPSWILKMLDAMPEAMRPALMRGVRLALAANLEDDLRLEPQLRALPDPLPRWLNQGTQALTYAGRGPDMPTRLREALTELD